MTVTQVERRLQPVEDLPQTRGDFDLAAEQIVLGAMMLSTLAADEAAEIVRASDFYKPAHGMVYQAIAGQRAIDEPVDPVAITKVMVASGDISRIGPAYLHDLVSSVPTAASVGWYANIVAEHAQRRDLARAGMQIVQVATDPGVDVAEARNRAERLLTEATVRQNAPAGRAWSDIVGPALQAIEEAAEHTGPRGLTVGIADMDQLFNGLRPGQLVVLGARPGMGKSIFAVDIARRNAMRHKVNTLIFSLEMSANELANRIISAETGIPAFAIDRGRLTDDNWTRIARFAGELADAPLTIDDTANLTLADIRSKARRLHRKDPVGLVIVDYLQLMATSSKTENRAVEVAEMSRGLKLLAKELGCPVIAASQLNRQPDARADKRPQLSDLRESGGIENDADIVILLHRPDYHDPDNVRRGEIDLIVAKNRNGPLGTVTAVAQLHLTRIVDYVPEGATS